MQFERRIETAPENTAKFFDDLSITDPQAVSNNNGDYLISHSNLSAKSQRQFIDWDIKRYFYYKTPSIPSQVIEKIVTLAEPKNWQTIYDPNCGDGSLFVEFYKRFPDLEFNFNGVAGSRFEHLFCLVNFYVNGIFADKRIEFEIEVSSPLQDTPQLYYEMKGGEDYSLREKIADVAASFVPFKREFNKGELDSRFFGLSYSLEQPEYAYIELMLNAVRDTGKAIAIVPDSVLYATEERFFREAYLSRDWVESVISLPENSFNQTDLSEFSIIVFNKNKAEKGFITFKSIDSRFEETKVSLDEVLSSGSFDLRVSRYASEAVKELNSILSKYPQDEIKKIKDLIDSSISGFNYSPNNRIAENSAETLPYVRVKDLSNNDKDFTLDISKVERKISPEKVTHKRTIINFSAVLISKIAPNLKPTYFNFTGQPIVIGSDVVALKVKKDVNMEIEYFLTQLYSQLVKTQVEMMSSGTTINRISIQDFLNIKIILPPLAEQELQIFERSGVIEEKAIVQEQLSVAIKEIETTEYDVIAAITHNLNQKLGQIVDDYGTLMLFLQNKEKTQMPIRFDEMLRPVRNGELVDNIPTFSKVANRLQNNLLDTAYTMKTTENILQKSVINTEELDIINFFEKAIKADFENPHFTLKIESKLKSLIVLADINALKDAFRNLIENAKKHSFTQSDQKYQIVFEISKYTDNSGDNFARIVYKNNGNPFPKSYRFEDYTRLGTRMGENKGTGIGGFFIKKVIDLHKGSFKEITLHENNRETFQVQMEILLPLAD